jgi:hypothetical protein
MVERAYAVLDLVQPCHASPMGRAGTKPSGRGIAAPCRALLGLRQTRGAVIPVGWGESIRIEHGRVQPREAHSVRERESHKPLSPKLPRRLRPLPRRAPAHPLPHLKIFPPGGRPQKGYPLRDHHQDHSKNHFLTRFGGRELEQFSESKSPPGWGSSDGRKCLQCNRGRQKVTNASLPDVCPCKGDYDH